MNNASQADQEIARLIKADREFRISLFQSADSIFEALTDSAKRVIERLGIKSTSDYPMEFKLRAPGDAVILLGRFAIHINCLREVAIQKQLVFSDQEGKRPTGLFDTISRRPAHECPEYYTAAIEFTRANSRAYQRRNPGTALVFACLYIGPTRCKIVHSTGHLFGLPDQSYENKDCAEWAPNVLESLLCVVMRSGVSTWQGIRSAPYEQLLLLPEEQSAISPERKIGFVPPTIEKDPI